MNEAIVNLGKMHNSILEEHYAGLQSKMREYYYQNGDAFAIGWMSDLDLDTDGVRNPKIKRYDLDHQDSTALGPWVDSKTLPYLVVPGGDNPYNFLKLHPTCGIGALATVIDMKTGNYCHCVVGDIGPRTKIGEASIYVHEALGYPRVDHRGFIINEAIDSVFTIIYLRSRVSSLHCDADMIARDTQGFWDTIRGDQK